MVDLLKFKAPGGLESYQRYGREIGPHLQRVGATVRYAGTAPAVVVGEGERPWWDAILIVEYPTPGVHRHGDDSGVRASARASRGGTGARRPDRYVGVVGRLAQDGQTALAAQLVQGSLHDRAHVCVDLMDVGVLAEPGGDVDRLQHLIDDLGRKRHVGREQ